jgi:hypothetical protein
VWPAVQPRVCGQGVHPHTLTEQGCCCTCRMEHLGLLLLLPVKLLVLLVRLPVRLVTWMRSKLPVSVSRQVAQAAAVPLPDDNDDVAMMSPGRGQAGLAAYLTARKEQDALAGRRAGAAGQGTPAAAAAAQTTPAGSGAVLRAPQSPFRFRESPPLPPRVAALAQAATPSPGPADGASPVSPIVQLGKILNPDTGHAIKIGGAKYNELVLAGYTPDTAQGMLVPPAGGGAGSSGRGRVLPKRGASPSVSETASASGSAVRRSGRR